MLEGGAEVDVMEDVPELSEIKMGLMQTFLEEEFCKNVRVGDIIGDAKRYTPRLGNKMMQFFSWILLLVVSFLASQYLQR